MEKRNKELLLRQYPTYLRNLICQALMDRSSRMSSFSDSNQSRLSKPTNVTTLRQQACNVPREPPGTSNDVKKILLSIEARLSKLENAIAAMAIAIDKMSAMMINQVASAPSTHHLGLNSSGSTVTPLAPSVDLSKFI